MVSVRNMAVAGQAIQQDIDRELGPPEEGLHSGTQRVVPMSVVRGTRGYIERVANQVNGAYENGWYDACAVLTRRLLETLTIEAYESHAIADNIKNAAGDFVFLGDLVDRCLQERTWNLGRNTKRALPKLKDVGDKSAHSRRYIAQRGDIDPLLADIRTVVQELVFLAGFK